MSKYVDSFHCKDIKNDSQRINSCGLHSTNKHNVSKQMCSFTQEYTDNFCNIEYAINVRCRSVNFYMFSLNTFTN